MLFADAKESIEQIVGRESSRLAVVPFSRPATCSAQCPPRSPTTSAGDAFVHHARGEWTMQPKLYVTNYPAGDFRAMPALGGGHALLKWVTSLPGQSGSRAADGDRPRAALERGDGGCSRPCSTRAP